MVHLCSISADSLELTEFLCLRYRIVRYRYLQT
uniref:Uncharacterized protein n=1 Tax=Podoviridae sp. ctZkC8 TaxID=2825259 RepID=A0A8S5UC19_9CAUD|nr:MAG TPA: hypothetical protein [Caudoviricetes sp.]DAF92016.1 MAG TPA: hypothetical protein [Podoviridae sp. ctZkC8]DAJ78095.1 MAG TPA: hypothetical protein [Caudoviricetes sp.]